MSAMADDLYRRHRLLLVKVAETSVRYDRDKKLPLYARAGIPEAWLVDIPGKALYVYRSPGPDGFAAVTKVTDLSALSPGLMPDCVVDLRGLL